MIATGIFFGFPLCPGGEGDAEKHQGRMARPCHESKPRPLAFCTKDESLERDWLVKAISFSCVRLVHSMSRMGHDLHQHLWDAWWCGLVGEDDLLS